MEREQGLPLCGCARWNEQHRGNWRNGAGQGQRGARRFMPCQASAGPPRQRAMIASSAPGGGSATGCSVTACIALRLLPLPAAVHGGMGASFLIAARAGGASTAGQKDLKFQQPQGFKGCCAGLCCSMPWRSAVAAGHGAFMQGPLQARPQPLVASALSFRRRQCPGHGSPAPESGPGA